MNLEEYSHDLENRDPPRRGEAPEEACRREQEAPAELPGRRDQLATELQQHQKLQFATNPTRLKQQIPSHNLFF